MILFVIRLFSKPRRGGILVETGKCRIIQVPAGRHFGAGGMRWTASCKLVPLELGVSCDYSLIKV
jgi:hypothetical protein